MKTETHPEYIECRVTCSCGNNFLTRATVPELHVELCAECHPFYTGKQKLVDTGGRVERFQRRYAEAEKAGGKKKDEDEEAPAKAARRRKAPVAARQPRPKFEQRPERGDDRGDRGGRGGRGVRGGRGEGGGRGRGERGEAGGGEAKAPEQASSEQPSSEQPPSKPDAAATPESE